MVEEAIQVQLAHGRHATETGALRGGTIDGCTASRISVGVKPADR